MLPADSRPLLPPQCSSSDKKTAFQVLLDHVSDEKQAWLLAAAVDNISGVPQSG